jgi:hypothetical protein
MAFTIHRRSAFRCSFLALVASILLPGGPASAEDRQGIQVGTGMICDTRQQVERLLTLLDLGPQEAVGKVNAEEKNPNACGLATMAYTESAELSTARNRDGAFRIVQIVVIGVGTPQGFRPVAPTAFYSLVKIEEERA